MKDSIIGNVKKMRTAKGLSQKELAERVGVGRQAIYDMESGRYVPNTAVALRLAMELECRVEDLFRIEREAKSHPVVFAERVDGPGTRLSVARVGNELVAYPQDGRWLLSEGFHAADGFSERTEQAVRLFHDEQQLKKRILLLGCDPAFTILNAHISRYGKDAELLCRFASSLRALEGVRSGHAHLAATHLHNRGPKESNVEAAKAVLGKSGALIVGFSLFEEGLVVAPGNPYGIATVADLTKEGIRFVNRDRGAAIRVLLDDQLARFKISSDQIQGYDRVASSHIEGAQFVTFGLADAALGLRAVAATYHLDFVPIQFVRCDLVIPRDFRELPAVGILLDILQTMALRTDLSSLPGYEASVTGKVIEEF
jgi:putative molybdopterin biosynthesis protein